MYNHIHLCESSRGSTVVSRGNFDTVGHTANIIEGLHVHPGLCWTEHIIGQFM